MDCEARTILVMVVWHLGSTLTRSLGGIFVLDSWEAADRLGGEKGEIRH